MRFSINTIFSCCTWKKEKFSSDTLKRLLNKMTPFLSACKFSASCTHATVVPCSVFVSAEEHDVMFLVTFEPIFPGQYR